MPFCEILLKIVPERVASDGFVYYSKKDCIFIYDLKRNNYSGLIDNLITVIKTNYLLWFVSTCKPALKRMSLCEILLKNVPEPVASGGFVFYPNKNCIFIINRYSWFYEYDLKSNNYSRIMKIHSGFIDNIITVIKN